MKIKIFEIRSGRAKCYFHAALENHSKGTLVLVKQGLDFEQKSVLYDPNGRFLFVDIYAPNKIHEQEAFFQKIERNLDSYDFVPNSKIVIGGDFNIFF